MLYKFNNTNSHQITIPTTATALKDLVSLEGADVIYIQPENNVYYLYGNKPTVDTGMQIEAGEIKVLTGIDINELYLIASNNTNATIQLGKLK